MTDHTARDFALRTISDDGSFRVLVASTTHTTQGVLDAQNPTDQLRGLLVDLVSAAVLLRVTMSPDYRLQAILQHPGQGSLVADSHPDGTTRAMVQLPLDAPFELGPATLFAVHRAMFSGELHQGIVETSREQQLSDVVTGYLHRSEQITSVVGLSHRFEEGFLTHSGGYIIQLLPHADHTSLALMTARLETLPPASELFKKHDDDPAKVAAELFGPIEYRTLGEDEFFSGCVCSKERIFGALATLSADDIAELIADDDVIEVGCDYCGTTYQIEADELS